MVHKKVNVLLDCKRKGQLNIDYLFAFLVLALSVIYAANIAMSSISPFYNTINSNNLHAEAWIFSDEFLRNIEIEDNVLNESLIYAYADNKTLLRDSFDERFSYRQKIVIEQYPIIFTDYVSGYNHLGSAEFSKDYGVSTIVNVTVRNSSSLSGYDRVDVDADVNYIGKDKNDIILISGVNYTISKIDIDGDFVAFERTVLSYGWGSVNRDMVSVNRYSTIDGFMARINILYF
ncbi:MAG: hypothetical protein KAI18_03185 [Candidatus Aenigmarchaeota archaeon]|nr:hypothetical protein [Candidatus Aenigmarchaeota archaeon]